MPTSRRKLIRKLMPLLAHFLVLLVLGREFLAAQCFGEGFPYNPYKTNRPPSTVVGPGAPAPQDYGYRPTRWVRWNGKHVRPPYPLPKFGPYSQQAVEFEGVPVPSDEPDELPDPNGQPLPPVPGADEPRRNLPPLPGDGDEISNSRSQYDDPNAPPLGAEQLGILPADEVNTADGYHAAPLGYAPEAPHFGPPRQPVYVTD
ncbi:MAG: hypothetical protein O2960_30400, partial [Verrucomicrobia bacterium]|nr:hypothetical protein [Verrucomicrobiota bacterium]